MTRRASLLLIAILTMFAPSAGAQPYVPVLEAFFSGGGASSRNGYDAVGLDLSVRSRRYQYSASVSGDWLNYYHLDGQVTTTTYGGQDLSEAINTAATTNVSRFFFVNRLDIVVRRALSMAITAGVIREGMSGDVTTSYSFAPQVAGMPDYATKTSFDTARYKLLAGLESTVSLGRSALGVGILGESALGDAPWWEGYAMFNTSKRNPVVGYLAAGVVWITDARPFAEASVHWKPARGLEGELGASFAGSLWSWSPLERYQNRFEEENRLAGTARVSYVIAPSLRPFLGLRLEHTEHLDMTVVDLGLAVRL